MPGIEDWIGNPISIVNSIFEKKETETFYQDVSEYFKSRINTSSLSMIPSLNDVPCHKLSPNSLVRYRCMIQDIFDNEYYLGIYEVKNCKSQQRYMRSGLYKDSVDFSNNEEMVEDSLRNKLKDRTAYYGVSIPGENEWVSDKFRNERIQNMPCTSSGASREKRPHEEAMDMEECSEMTGAHPNDCSEAQPTESKRSKNEHDEESQQMEVRNTRDNSCIQSKSRAEACIIKYYDSHSFKLNEVVEFVGVLAPEQSHPDDFSSSNGSAEAQHHPANTCSSSSSIPKIHAVAAISLQHINSYVNTDISRLDVRHFFHLSPAVKNEVRSNAVVIRNQLQAILEQCFLGDKLAADFMICHLMSSVYVRKETLALGKCCLNFSKIQNPTYAVAIHDILKQLLTKSLFLPMLLTTMNNQKFNPKRDAVSNKLHTGLLQLSNGTHIIVDELALTTGQLQPQGIQNLTALGNVIRWQKLEYDYNFHKGDHDCDIPVCIMSEGKSILPCDFHIPIIPSCNWTEWDKVFEDVKQHLTPSIFQGIRNYISVARQMDYTVPDDMQKMVQDDFVNMRRDDSSIGADDLHSLLVLVRCYALSVGQEYLTPQLWEKVKTMETERKQRFPTRN